MTPEGRGPISASHYLKTAQVFQSQCFFKRCLYPIRLSGYGLAASRASLAAYWSLPVRGQLADRLHPIENQLRIEPLSEVQGYFPLPLRKFPQW